MRASWLGVVLVAGCVRLPTQPLLVDDAARRGLVPGTAQSMDFSVSKLSGGAPYRLSDDRGSVVLIDVWATWCEPCRESLPVYDDIAKQFRDRGLKVYAMSIDAEPSGVAPFLAELKVSLPVLFDPEAATAGATLGVKQLPTSFLFDRKGTVRRVHEGLSEDFMAQTLSEVEALLVEPASR